MPPAWPLRFGSFFSPIHAPREDPTLALHRDIELIETLDALGYDEVWIGEHHSTGWEYICSPEVFLAHVAARTQRIRLGTGVISLPYHHPFNVAERVVLLDHLSRGRAMLGVGSGALAYDAYLYGLESSALRGIMEEDFEVVLALLAGERITRKTDRWELRDAAIQLRPYSDPCFEVAVTCAISPAGAKLAGRHGVSLLSLSATQAATVSNLRGHWDVVEEQAAKYGRSVDRRTWRMVGPMHVAETRAQARRDVAKGLDDWIYYNTKVGTLGLVSEDASSTDEYIDGLIENGFAVIGTPDDAAAQIDRLQEASGGFGTFLFWEHDWADRAATARSHELFAAEVAPRYKGLTGRLAEAESYALAHRAVLAPQAKAARAQATEDYEAEKARDAAAQPLRKAKG